MVHSFLNPLIEILLKARISKKAQGLIEYALIILLIVIVVITALGLLGVRVNSLYENVINSLPES